MCSGTEVGFLRNYATAAKFNFPQGIEISPIPDAGSVAENYMPWNLYPSPLMDERSPFDAAPEDSQP
jgi:hypothetical protein